MKERVEDSTAPVTMMLGGAGGAYTELFANYSTFYPVLVSTLKTYQLNGIDLDIEEQVTLANTEMLIQDLNRDFGSVSSSPWRRWRANCRAAAVCRGSITTSSTPTSGI